MAITVNIKRNALLDYVQTGRRAVNRVRRAMYTVANVGRRVARQQIRAQFGVRTGQLRRKASRMRSRVTVRSYEISAAVKRIPRLMNVYERGATLAQGRGFLAPRPVIGPGQDAMIETARVEIGKILAEVGR